MYETAIVSNLHNRLCASNMTSISALSTTSVVSGCGDRSAMPLVTVVLASSSPRRPKVARRLALS
jgi:hypothetical protein